MAKTKIDYDTVVAATSGDALAAGAVLDYFNDFMDGLCTGFYTDADGFWDYGIDTNTGNQTTRKKERKQTIYKHALTCYNTVRKTSSLLSCQKESHGNRNEKRFSCPRLWELFRHRYHPSGENSHG